MILFTADTHLRLAQKNVPVSWALNRYRMFFQQIKELESKCSLHIIGGDLFDRAPSMLELELYFDFIVGVTIPTIIFSGNHEATRKNKTFLSQLVAITKKANPLVDIVTTSKEYKSFTILPYTDLHKSNSIESLNKEKPLFTHVRGEIPPHVKPEVNLDRFKKFPIVFAGDLHAHSNTQRNIVYPGSPVTTSFHRQEVKTGCLLIDENTWQWKWHELELPQLIRLTVDDPKDMVRTDFHHTIYELEGDLHDLATVKNTELLDKKIVKQSSEATLVLNKEMNIQQELVEYLRYILELPEKTIQNILGVYNDYTQKVELE